MSSEGTGRAPMLPLRELVERYRALAGDFGTPVALTAFGLTRADTELFFPVTTRTTTSAVFSISVRWME